MSQLQVLAHVAAAGHHATEVSAVAASENRDLRTMALSSAIMGTVN